MGVLNAVMSKAPASGDVLGVHFQLIQKLGQGGFGVVWKAQDARTGDIVAVKFPPHQFALNPKVVNSLRQECQVLKTLSHPNICRLIDLAKDDQYGPLLVTEFVNGIDLRRASRGLSCGELVETLIGLLHGLAYLHGQKIMHLDLKPANILVGATGPKLIDFGLASFTSPEHYAGTMSYAAPETVKHEPRTVSADIYSLGVLMYECLTGTNPFWDNDPKEAKRRQRELTPDPPNTLRGDIPEWLSALTMNMIRKDPGKRYSVGEILDKIRMGHESHQAPDAAHLRSFATASGKLVGRRDILKQIRSALVSTSEPGMYRAVIEGPAGMGKTRLMDEIKFGAQVIGLQTIVLNSAASASPTVLAPVAEALAATRHPVLLLLDDFDKWEDQAPALKSLLETLHTHPHPPTWIGCVMAISRADEKPDFVLKPFTEDELSQYLSAVAPIPDEPRMQLARQLLVQTQGHPKRVADLMERMVARRYFASDSGQWDASIFDDMTVEISEVFEEDAPAIPGNRLLEVCKAERLGGHAAKAFERIVQHSNRSPLIYETDHGLLVEAASSALACGRASEALQLIERIEHGGDATILYWKGILLSALRHLKDAKFVLETAQKAATTAGDDVLAIRIANQLARCAMLDLNYDEAVAAYKQTLAHAKKLPKDKQDQIVNNDLGYALLLKGRHAEALPILEEHMRLCEKMGHARRYLNAAVQIGDCHAIKGEISQATAMYMKAIIKAKEAQQVDILSHAYNQLGKLQFENNMLDVAPATLNRAIAINHAIGDLSAAAINTTNLGLCQLRAGLNIDANINLETARAFLERCPDGVQRTLVPCLVGLAEIASQEKQKNKGIVLLNEAEALANRHNIHSEYKDPILSIRETIAGH